MKNKDERDLKALISLVDEPNDEIFDEIASKIQSYGIDAFAPLHEKSENCFDTVTQQRLQKLIHHILFENLCHELEKWIESGSKELFDICMHIARFEYHSLNEEVVRKEIENIINEVWLELNEYLTGFEKIKVINHILFDLHGFKGNIENFYDIKNFYLDKLFETSMGSTLTLGILYLIVAQRLGMPVYGVNLPQQFILAYTNVYTIKNPQFSEIKKVLFYINPFNKGAMFSRKEVELLLMEIKTEPQEKYFTTCTNTDIISRLIANLIFIYRKSEQKQKVKELETLKNILNKKDSE